MSFDINEIINLEWEDEEKIVIERILTHFKTWKKFVPRHLEKDIIFIIELAIKEKKKIMELTNN